MSAEGDVRREDAALARHLRIDDRELDAGGRNRAQDLFQ
jgi:hypothetical protein